MVKLLEWILYRVKLFCRFKKNPMKFITVAFTVLIFLITSCNSSNSNLTGPSSSIQKTEDSYIYSYDYKQPNQQEKEVKFSISNILIDSLQIPDSSIISMCKTAALYADFYVKHKPTYKINEYAQIYFIREENKFTCSISGVAENSYGVPDELSTYIDFGRDFKLLTDSSGLPSITSF